MHGSHSNKLSSQASPERERTRDRRRSLVCPRWQLPMLAGHLDSPTNRLVLIRAWGRTACEPSLRVAHLLESKTYCSATEQFATCPRVVQSNAGSNSHHTEPRQSGAYIRGRPPQIDQKYRLEMSHVQQRRAHCQSLRSFFHVSRQHQWTAAIESDSLAQVLVCFVW